MWLFLNNAFLSIVAPTTPPSATQLLVRARIKGDIERVFPAAVVSETPDRDYRFRALVDRGEVAIAASMAVEAIDYGNFKDSIPKADEARHSAYLGVWAVMDRYQDRATPRDRAYGAWYGRGRRRRAKKPTGMDALALDPADVRGHIRRVG